MKTEEIIHAYYRSLGRKDDAWKRMWSEQASFSDASGVLDARGRDAVIQSFTPFLGGVASVEIVRLIESGASACAVVRYRYRNSTGAEFVQDVAEVWDVASTAGTLDGSLASLRIYFDLTAYRQFMRG